MYTFVGFGELVVDKTYDERGNLLKQDGGDTTWNILYHLGLMGEKSYAIGAVGNDENLSAAPFLNTLESHGVQVEPFQGQPGGKLAVLCWRRYQAFKGKIGLDEQETASVQQALAQHPDSAVISFANPWSVRGLNSRSQLFAFSPSPVFQQAAAEVLLGKWQAAGQLPITL